MNKVRFHYNYPISVDIDTDKQVDVYIDKFEFSPLPENVIRIIILEEPKKEELFTIVMKNKDLYTHLLTFHDVLLASNSKARLFLPMAAWVKNYVSKQKEFSVSTVVGGKKDSAMFGYALRHGVWKCRECITIPRKFYLSGNAKAAHVFKPWREVSYANELVLGVSKEPLFDSMFHIAIENTSIKNYFSEKLLDCFQSRTVPIYWGCQNIGDYFNIDGIFVARNGQEIINICNKLTLDVYNQMLPAMEDNYQRSLKWCDHQEQIKNKVIEIINEL